MAIKSEAGRWIVEFQCRGRRVHRRCPPGTKREEAVELETRIRREIFEQRDLGRSPVVPLPAAVELWLRESVAGRKSERETRNHARALVDAIDGKTLADLIAVADAYRATKLAPATINRRLSVLKAVAKFAHRKGWTPTNLSALIPMLPEHNARHVYLTPKQIRGLLAKMKDEPAARAFAAIAVYTGMRKGEIMRLRKDQIGAKAIDLGTNTKTGAPRRIPIIPQVKPFLRFVPFGQCEAFYSRRYRTARALVGLDHVHFHDLRHTTASLMVQAGVDIYTVGRLLGHSAQATTARYAHLADRGLSSAMDTFSNALRGGKAA